MKIKIYDMAAAKFGEDEFEVLGFVNASYRSNINGEVTDVFVIYRNGSMIEKCIIGKCEIVDEKEVK